MTRVAFRKTTDRLSLRMLQSGRSLKNAHIATNEITTMTDAISLLRYLRDIVGRANPAHVGPAATI